MAEVAGLVLGVVTLGSLFSTCIEAFDKLELARTQDRDLSLLHQKLENQQARFILWGESLGLHDPPSCALQQAIPTLRKIIHGNLCHVMNLFDASISLAARYGLQADSKAGFVQDGYNRPFSRLFRRARHHTPSITPRQLAQLPTPAPAVFRLNVLHHRKFRWVVRDRARFMDLVQHLRELVDDLQDLAHSLVITSGVMTQIDLDAVTSGAIELINEEDLELIAQADEDTPNLLSDAASIRLERLSQCSASFYSATMSVASTYYTAHSKQWSVATLSRKTSPQPEALFSIPEAVDPVSPVKTASDIDSLRFWASSLPWSPGDEWKRSEQGPPLLTPSAERMSPFAEATSNVCLTKLR